MRNRNGEAIDGWSDHSITSGEGGYMKEADKVRGVFRSLAGFIPQKVFAVQFVDTRRKLYEYFDAALLYADISGFTAMSEKLTALGREGSEEVTKIINGFFGPLIDVILGWGGDIYRFGGDAIISFFPSQYGKYSAGFRSLCAAREAVAYVKKHSRVKTRAGTFAINMHVGITKGPIFFRDLQTDFFIGGKAAFKIMNIVDRASAGEIVVDDALRNDAPEMFFKKKQHSLWKFTGSRKAYEKATMPARIIVGGKISVDVLRERMARLRAYVPPWLYERIQLKPTFDQSDGEHRRVAIAFLHVSNIPYERNPREAAMMLVDVHSVLSETIKKYDGWLNKMDICSDGARILAVFGFPTAYEDCEQRAALFAHDLIRHSDMRRTKVKAGVNVGSVFAAPVGSEKRREYTVMGDSVNLAARLAAGAPTDAVLVSEPVFNRTYSLFEYERHGEKKYKGKKRSILSYRLIDRKSVDRRVLSRWISESARLVGREKEVKKFRELMAKVKKKKGQILAVWGEAGMGKSRLTQEYVKLLRSADFNIIGGNCLSYGRALSYHPWIDALVNVFGISPMDPPAARKKKIRKAVTKVDRRLANWLPVIGEAIGVPFGETKLTRFLDAKIRKQRFFDIVFDIIKYHAAKKTTCIILEDLHWIDSVSMELINYIGRNVGDKKILFLLVFRPLREKEEFMEKDCYTSIQLKELSKVKTAELAGNLLNISALPETFKKIVIDKSQGNPFYVEEIVKSFIEQGLVSEDLRGKWKFSGEIKKIEIPDNIEGVILNRIDRLDIQDKDVLQTASVLGREFDEFLIAGIYSDKHVLKRALSNLRLLDLLRLEKEKSKGQKKTKYIFKHVLTQEVAYGTLSFAKKRELHKQTGVFIEEKFKRRKDEFLGLLSHHFYFGMDYDKALLYSVEAGEKAKKVYANEEAIEFFTRAIESYEKLEGPIK